MRCGFLVILLLGLSGCGSAVIPAASTTTTTLPSSPTVSFTGYAGGHNDLITGVAYDTVGALIYVSGMSFDVSGNRYGFVARYTTAGALDTTFNSPNGYKLTPSGGIASGYADYFNAIAIDSAGRPVICGSSKDSSGYFRALVARYTTAGALDFSTIGTASGFAGGNKDFYNSIAISAGGNIYCAGYSKSSTAGIQRTVIARYTSAGALDTAGFANPNGYILGTAAGFGAGGVDTLNSLSIDSVTGNLVGVGTSTNGAGDVLSLVVRYSATGTLDTAGFNNPNGFALGPSIGLASGHSDAANAVVVTGTSTIFVAGSSLNASLNSRTAITKYTSAGALDTAAFANPNGYVLGPNPGFAGSTQDSFYATGLDPITGNILVAGKSYNGTVYQYLVSRYTTAGVLDTTFNTNGYAVATLSNNTVAGNSSVASLVVDPAQNVIMGGTILYSNGYQQPFLIEYSSAGVRVF